MGFCVFQLYVLTNSDAVPAYRHYSQPQQLILCFRCHAEHYLDQSVSIDFCIQLIIFVISMTTQLNYVTFFSHKLKCFTWLVLRFLFQLYLLTCTVNFVKMSISCKTFPSMCSVCVTKQMPVLYSIMQGICLTHFSESVSSSGNGVSVQECSPSYIHPTARLPWMYIHATARVACFPTNTTARLAWMYIQATDRIACFPTTTQQLDTPGCTSRNSQTRLDVHPRNSYTRLHSYNHTTVRLAWVYDHTTARITWMYIHAIARLACFLTTTQQLGSPGCTTTQQRGSPRHTSKQQLYLPAFLQPQNSYTPLDVHPRNSQTRLLS